MKYFAFLTTLFLAGTAANAQLKADAGRDTVWCLTLNSNTPPPGPIIGGAPAGSGGAVPYAYRWSVLEPGYVANTILDNDTIANPQFIKTTYLRQGVDSLHFILRVTDVTSIAPAYDTVVVFFSSWMCTLGECITQKKTIDTFRLSASCYGRLQPITYQWSPGIYLSDSTAANPQSWTPVTQTYTSIITDRKGCRLAGGSCKVFVDPASVIDATIGTDEVMISPNPMTAESLLKSGTSWQGGTLSLFTAAGKLTGMLPVTGTSTSLRPIIPSVSGLYFYRITSLEGKTQYGKLTVQ